MSIREGVNDFEYAIAGAGLAGLCLATSLNSSLQNDKAAKKRICLIEPRAKYEQDHIWCFWNNVQMPLSVPIKKQWNEWKVSFGGKTSKSVSSEYPYCCVFSQDYYAQALSQLGQSRAVEIFLGESLEKADYTESNIKLKTSKRIVTSRLLFDSRPPQMDANDFKQDFLGLHIRTKDNIFEAECLTLMDFSKIKVTKGFHFFYVLPFSRTEALVESVYIGLASVTEAEHRSFLSDYFKQKFGLETFEQLYIERGCLPMQPISIKESDRRHYAIGTRAGLLRSSTGYAFASIHRFSEQLAMALSQEELPDPPNLLSAKAKLLDLVLLSYLRQHPDDGPLLLSSLFERVDPNIVVRFLADRSSLVDDASIFTAMPKKFELSQVMARKLL